jgi:omega-hydroxy-beta-dihydromenaquinone-9 sulfotransferase
MTGETSSIFITGNSRSGTTMMAKILGLNSQVFMFYELHFFEQLWYPTEPVTEITKEEAVNLFCKLISLQRQGFLTERDPDQFKDEAQAYFNSCALSKCTFPSVFMNFLLYESMLHSKKIPCEQTPRNLFFVDEICELYTGSKIICMIRDPRDVLLSQKYKWKRRFFGHADLPRKEIIRARFNYHPVTISKLWNSSTRKIVNSIDRENFYLVKFEELIAEPEKIIRNLCVFLNIQFHSSMLLIPTEGSSIANDEIGKIGIDKTRSGNFLKGGLTNTEIYICQRITSGFRSKFGYEDVDVNPNIFSMIAFYTTFPIKLSIALLLNLKRSKNLLNSVKRRFISKESNPKTI